MAVSCHSEPASESGSSATLPGSGLSSTTTATLQARLLASDGSDNVPSAPPGEVGRVIVVGAGLAGLTAALALHLSGAEVPLLPAGLSDLVFEQAACRHMTLLDARLAAHQPRRNEGALRWVHKVRTPQPTLAKFNDLTDCEIGARSAPELSSRGV